MPDTDPFKYRAFLSYSHADTAVAMRVHRRLEGFHIDKELVGRVTPTGPIPKALRPIFRDRNDFEAGSSLRAETGTALDNAAALILLASPHAARSKYANEEVRLFKSRHPDRPLIPLIVGGEPGDADKECFPPALRFAVTPDGAVSDTPADVLAADLREKGDGFELALAKVVARLIGLAPDDVYRRAERERRKQGRLRAAIAAVIAVLAVTGGGFSWQSYRQKQTLAEISALVDKYSLVTPAQAAAPGAKQSLTEAITAIAQGAATDPRYAEALALLKAGKAADAEPLLRAVAEDKAKRADRDAKDAAAAYRNLASIASVTDPGRARGYYAEAARLDPSEINGMLLNAEFQKDAGQLDAAQAAYARVIATAKPGSDDDDLFWGEIGVGDIQQQRNDLGSALANFEAAQTIADRLTKANPGNPDWQRSLAVAYNRIGKALVARGDLPGALKFYRDALAIANGVAKTDPSNTDWQRDLSVSDDRIGDVLVAQGHLPEALKAFRDGLAISQRLATLDVGNAGWQRDLSVSYDRVGDILVVQGNLPDALNAYRNGFAIRERLAKADPGNAEWQRDLSIAYNKIGDVESAQANLPEALKAYRDALAIRTRLAATDVGNAQWQHDLSVLDDRIGDVLVAQSNLSYALKYFRDAQAIRQKLAAADPGNTEWQRSLSVSNERLGDIDRAQGNLPAALEQYRASLARMAPVRDAEPSNMELQRFTSITLEKIGDVLTAQHNLPEAMQTYRDGLAIGHRLTDADPGNTMWQRDLSVSYSRIGDVSELQGDFAGAMSAYRDDLAILKSLVTKDGTNAAWRHDLEINIRRMGSLAYIFVLAGDFNNALAAAEEAIALDPEAAWLYANKAHALMFLGRTDAARRLYLHYDGEKNVQDGKSWQTLVVGDFTEFRKAGRTSPLMDEIEKLFRHAGSDVALPRAHSQAPPL